MSKGVHNGVQVQPKSVAEQLGRMTVGPVQPSGCTLNLAGSVQTRDMPPDRFVTHNMTRVSALRLNLLVCVLFLFCLKILVR
ncbi:unnamed protein product [Trichobilharzia regenti]|nr:unnamed protein product [Trichobilharzia regenti]